MITVYSISALILAYLCGSIPTAVWIGQAFYGVDVREYGSGNAGATNTFRVLGKKAGIPVMLLDILKGWTATNLAYFIGVSTTGAVNSIAFTNYELALGIAAVMGHLFPVFAGFRGGKGIATLFGMVLAVNLHAALLCVGVFILVLLITRYVSLSSIVAGFTYLLGVTFVFPVYIKSVIIYGMCICALILVTHQKNIERLLKGKESRVNLFKKKNSNMKKAIPLVIVFFSILYSCSTVPLTGRKQLTLVDDSQINQSAAQSYSQLLSDPKTIVVNTGTDAQRVKRVGARLATAIESYLKTNGFGDQYSFKWEFNLIKSGEVNAWCMPGGKVAVYSGLMPLAHTDAELATVMGHEIGHAIARHSAERISQQMAVQGIGGAVGVASSNNSQATQTIINQLYGVGGQLVLLKYSRNQESEADRLGLTFMALAGYDPHAALTFWQTMSAQNKGGAPIELLSTHPADATRIADIQNRIPEAMKYYKH